jgi:uncharacterized protein YdhG (YjbR/CyaY superfamily)
MKTYANIDAYIAEFPEEVQVILEKVRATIQRSAPLATEAISYGIPTFKLHGNLVHFAGYKHHVGFYPGAEPIVVFKDQLKKYKTSKGTIQFPITDPIPYALIAEITKYRVKQNNEKEKIKKKKK